MSGKIYCSKYKDIGSVVLESDRLKATFLPKFGGKMASLMDKKTSREFLVQGENAEYKTMKYDGNYVEAECSGFDDMFPTIDMYYYDCFPWNGTKIPDHGEVCGLQWEYAIEDDCLCMSTYGVRLPYKLEKRIGFMSENTLGINYKATNLSNFDMDFLWAAHAMINAEENGELIFPFKEQQNIECVFSWDKNFGTYGDKMAWPEAVLKNGEIERLDVTTAKNENGNNYKYYFKEKMPEGWCVYYYKTDGTSLKISFPEEKVPYMGIWVNEGSFKGFYNIALEPCTGSFDRPDLAKLHNQNSILKAKDEYSWFLNFQITGGSHGNI